jgi:hypothetical protein
MLTYSSSFKVKPKTGVELAAQYSSTLPNEAVRKTINNTNMPPKVHITPFRKKHIAKLSRRPMSQIFLIMTVDVV